MRHAGWLAVVPRQGHLKLLPKHVSTTFEWHAERGWFWAPSGLALPASLLPSIVGMLIDEKSLLRPAPIAVYVYIESRKC
jgi:hypothetical protein